MTAAFQSCDCGADCYFVATGKCFGEVSATDEVYDEVNDESYMVHACENPDHADWRKA